MGKYGILAEPFDDLVSNSRLPAVYAIATGSGYTFRAPHVGHQKHRFAVTEGTTGTVGVAGIVGALVRTTNFHSSIVNVDPIERLHRAHMAIKLSMCRDPPAASGMLWPTWKSKAVMRF